MPDVTRQPVREESVSVDILPIVTGWLRLIIPEADAAWKRRLAVLDPKERSDLEAEYSKSLQRVVDYRKQAQVSGDVRARTALQEVASLRQLTGTIATANATTDSAKIRALTDVDLATKASAERTEASGDLTVTDTAKLQDSAKMVAAAFNIPNATMQARIDNAFAQAEQQGASLVAGDKNAPHTGPVMSALVNQVKAASGYNDPNSTMTDADRAYFDNKIGGMYAKLGIAAAKDPTTGEWVTGGESRAAAARGLTAVNNPNPPQLPGGTAMPRQARIDQAAPVPAQARGTTTPATVAPTTTAPATTAPAAATLQPVANPTPTDETTKRIRDDDAVSQGAQPNEVYTDPGTGEVYAKSWVLPNGAVLRSENYFTSGESVQPGLDLEAAQQARLLGRIADLDAQQRAVQGQHLDTSIRMPLFDKKPHPAQGAIDAFTDHVAGLTSPSAQQTLDMRLDELIRQRGGNAGPTRTERDAAKTMERVVEADSGPPGTVLGTLGTTGTSSERAEDIIKEFNTENAALDSEIKRTHMDGKPEAEKAKEDLRAKTIARLQTLPPNKQAQVLGGVGASPGEAQALAVGLYQANAAERNRAAAARAAEHAAMDEDERKAQAAMQSALDNEAAQTRMPAAEPLTPRGDGKFPSPVSRLTYKPTPSETVTAATPSQSIAVPSRTVNPTVAPGHMLPSDADIRSGALKSPRTTQSGAATLPDVPTTGPAVNIERVLPPEEDPEYQGLLRVAAIRTPRNDGEDEAAYQQRLLDAAGNLYATRRRRPSSEVEVAPGVSP